jgi:hypothetical protein
MSQKMRDVGASVFLVHPCKRTRTVRPKAVKYHYIEAASSLKKAATMHITLPFAPLLALIAGLLMLIVPRLLHYIVGLYMLIIGVLGLFGASNVHLR